MITKIKVKKMFNDAGIQCPIATLNMIDDHVTRLIRTMAYRCEYGNIKRLTPDLFWVALGNHKPNKNLRHSSEVK